MTTFIPMPRDPDRTAHILEHAMRWYDSSDEEAAPVKRPVKVRLITNPAAMVAYAKAAFHAAIEMRQRYGDDTRR